MLLEVVASIVVIILGMIGKNILEIGKPPSKGLVESSKWRVVGKDDLHGVEDFVKVDENRGLYLGSNGDVWHGITHSTVGLEKGSIILINAEDEEGITYRHLEIQGYPFESSTFHPHGLYYSQENKVLYVVNHSGGDERIELFYLHGDSYADMFLTFKRSIQSSLFPHHALNDVCEGGRPGEVYVTYWVPFGFPKTGLDHPKNLLDRLLYRERNLHLMVLQKAFKLPGSTQVLRCSFPWDDDSADAKTEVAATGLISANGITINSKTKSEIYVVDCFGASLHCFDRAENGSLTRRNIQPLPHAVDNVEYDSLSGNLYLGTMNRFDYNLLKGAIPALKHSLFVEGGLTRAKISSENEMTFEDILHQDGTLFGPVSMGFLYKNHVVLSGPEGNGIYTASLKDRHSPL